MTKLNYQDSLNLMLRVLLLLIIFWRFHRNKESIRCRNRFGCDHILKYNLEFQDMYL